MIKIEAASRLQQVLAADANDAGKVVLWIEKALDVKGVPSGKAGRKEVITFKTKADKEKVILTVTLDHDFDPPTLEIFGHFGRTEMYTDDEATGRQAVIAFKNKLRAWVPKLAESQPEIVTLMKKLISAKSKVE